MYHLHLGVIRVCAIRSVACAGRRRRRRWRLTHLAAAVVDILARTDQQGRTHTSRRRATVDANLAVRSQDRVAAGARKVSWKEEGKPGIGAIVPESSSSTASWPRRGDCVIVRLDYGDIRGWSSARLARYTASGERSQKRR